MRSILILLVIAQAYCSYGQLIPREDFIKYTIEDGLPSNFVYAVEQDDRGYIWIATDAGVSRFDGYEFKNYTLEDGLPDTEVIDLYKDSQGRIWLYSLNGKAAYIHDDSVYHSKNTPELRVLDGEARFTTIMEFNKKIYASIEGKIKIYDDGDIEEIEAPSRFTPVLVLNTTTKRIHALNYLDAELVGQDLKINNETGFGQISLSHVVFSNNTFFAHKERSDTVVFYDSFNQSSEYAALPIKASSLNLIKTRSNIFLASSEGLMQIDSVSREISFYAAIKNSSSALEDAFGNLWVTSLDEGLLLHKKKKIQTSPAFNKVDRLITVNSSELLIHHDDTLLSHLTKSSNASVISSFPELQYEELIQILKIKENYIVLTSEYASDIKGNNRIKTAAADMITDDHQIIMAFYSGMIVPIPIRREGEILDDIGETLRLITSQHYRQNNRIDIVNSAIRKILLERNRLHVGSDQGLLTFDFETQKASKNTEIPNIRIWDIAQTSEVLAVGTGGSGLFVKTTGKWIQITKEEGLLSNICRKIEVRNNSIWIVSDRGINQVTFGADGDYEVFDVAEEEGLPSKKVNDITFFDDTIYVSTEKGLAYFSSHTNFRESNEIPTYLDEIIVDDMALVRPQEPEISYKARNLKVKFTAIHYGEKDIFYSYRLRKENEAGTWLETEEREAAFSNIQPGDYQFEVRAKTKNSQWTKAVALPITITPPFWLTIWFQIIIILFSVFLGYSGYSRITKSRRMRAQLAADRVEAQLQALRAQINPHFLFNALNSIKRFILKNENDAAESYLTKYSHHIRDILHYSRKLTLSIHQEVTLLERYVEIEKIRTGEVFQFKVEIDNNIDQYETFIPTMVIQPFVENAIWHGILKERKGQISLSFKKIEDQIQIRLEDNGVGFDGGIQTGDDSLGISLVQERIRLIGVHYNSRTNLKVTSRPGGGTQVLVLIPADLI